MATPQELQPLMQAGKIGNLKLKNRLIQAAMHTRFASHFGEVTDQLIAYHQERARGGVALIILENTAVNWEVGRAAGNPVRIDDDIFVSGLSDLTSAVHAEGTYIAAQLHHAGRQNSSANTEGRVQAVGPSPVMSEAIGEVPRDLDQSEIPEIIREFTEGARRSVDAGFDMVEIHGSHGYLLTQFLSPESNLREDEYGGSFENRARLPLEIVQAVRDTVGPDFPLSYRISVEERTVGGMDIEEGIRFCQMIEPYIDAFNVTVGTYDSMQWIFTMQGTDPGALLPVAKQVKEAVNRPVIAISRLGWMLEDAAKLVDAGEIDFVAMARTQLADPRLVAKKSSGRDEAVRPCIACNDCVGGFLFNGWRVHCAVNPELGREYQLDRLLRPTSRPQEVVVVGGGVVGCEAARVAAVRGHRVTLFEKDDRLGGQLRLAAVPSYKHREMEALIRYYESELDRLGVAVHLGEVVTTDANALDKAETVIVATGPVPSLPETGLDALKVLASQELPEGKILVRGASELGFTVAAFAAELGRETVVKADDPELGFDMNPLLAGYTVDLLEAMGVTILDDLTDIGSFDGTVVEVPTWTADESDWDLGERVRVMDARSGPRRSSGAGYLYDATQLGFHVGTKI